MSERDRGLPYFAVLKLNGMPSSRFRRLEELRDTEWKKKLEKSRRAEWEERYEEEMEIYFQNHTGGKEKLNCEGCSRAINRGDLVRYFEINLHHDCFKKLYVIEREIFSEEERAYYDRVFQMRRGK